MITRNKKQFLLLLLTILLSANLLLLIPKPAQAQFIVADVWARVRDTIKDFKDNFTSILKEHSALMWKQAQLYFGTKLAKDAAISIASGNPGQMMMFVTDPGEYWGDLADATAGEYLDSLSQNVFGKSLCQPTDINVQIEREIGIRSFLSGLKGQITNIIPNMCEEMCKSFAPTEREITDPVTGKKTIVGYDDKDLFKQVDEYNDSAKKLMTQVLDIEKNITKGVGENIWENVRRVVYPYKKILGDDGGTPLDSSDDIYENKYKDIYCNSPEQWGFPLETYYQNIETDGVVFDTDDADGIKGNGSAFGQMIRALFKIESKSEPDKVRAFCGFFNDPATPDFILKIINPDAWTTKDSKEALGILYLRYAAKHSQTEPGDPGALYELFGAFKANEILIKNKALTASYVDPWPLLNFLVDDFNEELDEFEPSPLQKELQAITKIVEKRDGSIIPYLYESNYVPQPNNRDFHSIIDNQINTDSPIFNLADDLFALDEEIGNMDENFFEAMDNYNTCIMTCEKGEVKVPKNKCLATYIYEQAIGGSGLEKVGISGVNLGLTLDNVKVGDYGNYCEGGSRDWYPCSSDKDCQPEQGGNCKLRYVKSEDLRKIQQIASDITNNTAGLLNSSASDKTDINVWRNMAEFSSYFEPGNNPVGQLLTAVQESQEKSAGAKAQEEIERQSSGLLPQKSTVSGRRQLPPEAGMSRLERNLASLREANNQYTGSVLAQMWGVFANTLIQKLEEKLYSKGLNPQTFGGPFEGDPRGSLGTGRAVAEAQFADFANPEITVSSNPIQVLAVLTNGCEKNPDKRVYNECIIGSQFQEAISQKLSLSEAIKKRLLFENAIFGYKTKDSEPDIKSDKSAIPYSSMLVLRKYRIIPSSWELAAKYGLYELEQGKRTIALTLGEAMKGFATPLSPYYQLVDPNWVLKAPQFQCAKEGAGEVILSETPEVFQPGEDVIPKTVVARSSSCGDEQSCIRESADGQQCEKYGYCIREKNTWRFGSGSCDPMFNTCRTYQGPITPGQENKEVNYLESTLEQAACVQPEAKGCQEYRRDYRAVAPIFNFQFSIFNYSSRQFKDLFVDIVPEFNDTYDFFNDKTTEGPEKNDLFIDNKEEVDGDGKSLEKVKENYQTWMPDPSAYLDNSTPNPDGFLTQVPTIWQCTNIASGESCYFERIAGQEEKCEISSDSVSTGSMCVPWLEPVGDDGTPYLKRNIDNAGQPLVAIERVFGENRYWCGLPGGAGCFVSDVQNVQAGADGQPELVGGEIQFIDYKDPFSVIPQSQAGDHTTTIARKTCAVVGNKIDPADANNSIVIPVLDSVGQYLTCALGDPLRSRAVLNSPVLDQDGKLICDENSAGCQEFAWINFNADVYLSDQNQLAMLGKLMDKGKTLAGQGDSKSYQDIFDDKQFTQLGDNLPISENEFAVEPIYLNNKRVMCLAEDMACREIRDGDFTFAAKLNPRRDMCPTDCAGYNSFLALSTALESQLTPEKLGALNYFVPQKEESRICDAANEGCEVFSESSGADITTTTPHYFNKVAMCVIQDETDPLKSTGGADIETFRTIDGTAGFEPKAWRLMKSDQTDSLKVPIKDSYGNKIKYGDAINDVTNVIDNDPFIDKEDVTGNLVKIFEEIYNGPCVKFTTSDNPDNLICGDKIDPQFLTDALSSCLEFNTKKVEPENPENPDQRYAVIQFKDSDPNCREFLYFNNVGEAESYPLPLDKIIRVVDNTQVLDAASQCKPYIRERTRQAYNLINNESAQCPDLTKVGCRRYQGFELAVEGEVFKDDFSDGFAGAWQPKEGDVNSKLEITQGINVGDQALAFSSEIVRTIDKFQSYDEKARETLKDKEYTLSFWTKSTDDQSKIETVKLCSDAICSADSSIALNTNAITVNKEQIITLGSEAVNFAPLYVSIKQSGNDLDLIIDHIILKQQTDLFLIEPKVEKGETWAVPPQCDLNLGRICKAGASYVANCPADYCCGPNYDDEIPENDFQDLENLKTTQDKCYLDGKDYCELLFTAKNGDDVYVLDTPQQMFNYIGCENYQVNGADTALTVKNFGELCALEKVGCAPLINTFNTAGASRAVYNKDSGDILSYDANKISPPKIFTPEDTIEFWAFNADAQCLLEQKSCAYLAKPVVGIDYQVSGLESTIVKDDPAYYEQLPENPSNLCYLAQNQCRAYDSGAGQTVFKDPGNKICEYRTGSLAATPEWYEKNMVSAESNADAFCLLQDFTDKDSNIKVSRPKGVCVDGYGAAILNPNDSSSVYQCDYWVENRPDLPREKDDRQMACRKLLNLIKDGNMEAEGKSDWAGSGEDVKKDITIFKSDHQSLKVPKGSFNGLIVQRNIFVTPGKYVFFIYVYTPQAGRYTFRLVDQAGKELVNLEKNTDSQKWSLANGSLQILEDTTSLQLQIANNVLDTDYYFDDIILSPNIVGDCAPVSVACHKDQSMCAEIRDPKASSIEKSFFIINDPNKVNAGDCVSVDDEAGCKLFADMSLKDQTNYLTIFDKRADQTKKGESGNTDCNAPSCYNVYGDDLSGLKDPLPLDCYKKDPQNSDLDYKMCDSNKIIKVERDRTCGEWLECASSIQLAPDMKKAGDPGSEPLCLSRKPCDQWGTDDSCAHFAEDAVNVFSTTQILEEEYKSPKFTELSEQFYGGTFNKELQSRIKTVSGFSKIGMDVLTGQCLKGSTFAGKLCASGIDCFNDSQDEAEVATICKREEPTHEFVCQPGTPNAGVYCTFKTSCDEGDYTCWKPEVDNCQVCPSDNKRDTASGLNAFSASSKIDGNWYSLDNYDLVSKTTYPLIQELGDISLVKNGGFEEIDGAEEDLIVLDPKTNLTKNQKVLKPRYWLPGCEGSYSLECSKESPASAMTIVSRYERGKAKPNRTIDNNIQNNFDKYLVKEGNMSLMLGSNQGVKQRIDGVRSPGKYVLSAWVKNETASQAGLSVMQYDSGDSTSAINGSVHSTTCFKFTGNYSEFESKNDSYDNCLFVDKPTNGWQFVSKLINIESIPDPKEATIYITVELFNNSDGNIYFDEAQLRPHLQIQGEYDAGEDGADYSGVSFTGPACRLYAAEDALSCDARDEKGSFQRGWRGYCLEWKGDQCLNWWPVDMITGEANAIGTIENAGYAGPAPLYYCAESRDKNLPPKIKMPRLVCVAKNSPADLTYEGCKIVALVSDPKPEFYDLKEGDWKLGVDANNFGKDPSETGSGGKFSVKYLKKGTITTSEATQTAGLCLITPQGSLEGDNDTYDCIKACLSAQGLGSWDANKGLKVFWQGKNDGSEAYGGCEWTKDQSNWRDCGEDIESIYHKVVYFAFAKKDGNIDVGDNEGGCQPEEDADRIYRVVYGDLKYQAFCASPYCFGSEEVEESANQNYITYDNFYSIYYNADSTLALTGDYVTNGVPIYPRIIPRETRPQQCAVLSKVIDESGDNKAWAEIVHKGGAKLPVPLHFDRDVMENKNINPFEQQCVLSGKQEDKKVGYGALPYIYSPLEITMTPTNQETLKEQQNIRTPVEFYHINNPENDDENIGKMCQETYHAGAAFYACGGLCAVCVGGGPDYHGKICYSDTDCGKGKCGPSNIQEAEWSAYYVCIGGKYDKQFCQSINKQCIVDGVDTGVGCTNVIPDCNSFKGDIKCEIFKPQGSITEAQCKGDGGSSCKIVDGYIKAEKAFQDPPQGKNRLQRLFAKAYNAFEWVVDNSEQAIQKAIRTGFEVGIYDSSEITNNPNAKWDITQIINTCITAAECAETAGCQPTACVPVDSLGDYEECISRGDTTCINDCIKNSTGQNELTTCLKTCYTQKACCGADNCKDDKKCRYESSLVCTPAKNPYPQVVNIAVKQKNDGTVEIKPEDDHTIELLFGLTASQDQLPIKEIYIDWGDGETTTLGGIAWSADVPNNKSPNLRKFLHTYNYHQPTETIPNNPSKTYGIYNIDPRDPAKGVLCVVDDNCTYKPRIKVVDNWGWCNGDETGGVMGYYKDECYNKNSIPNENAWDYFEGTVKVLAPID